MFSKKENKRKNIFVTMFVTLVFPQEANTGGHIWQRFAATRIGKFGQCQEMWPWLCDEEGDSESRRLKSIPPAHTHTHTLTSSLVQSQSRRRDRTGDNIRLEATSSCVPQSYTRRKEGRRQTHLRERMKKTHGSCCGNQEVEPTRTMMIMNRLLQLPPCSSKTRHAHKNPTQISTNSLVYRYGPARRPEEAQRHDPGFICWKRHDETEQQQGQSDCSLQCRCRAYG